MSISIYCDGACGPMNPGGTASWAFILEGADLYEEHSGVIGSGPGMTNNVAEYHAVLEALRRLATMHDLRGVAVTIHCDASMCIGQMSGRWKKSIKNGKGHYRSTFLAAREEAAALLLQGVDLRFKWIPREQNASADALAKRAIEAS